MNLESNLKMRRIKKSPIGQDVFWPLIKNAMKTGDIKRYAVLKMRQQSFRPGLPEAASAIFGGAKEHQSPSYPEKSVGNIIEA